MGVYSDEQIKDKARFTGNPNYSIFCLHPVIKIARTIHAKGGTNYCYLNTMKIQGSKMVNGLGFGGHMGDFKLFFDPDDMEH